MLANLGVRWKILAVLTLPVVFLTAAAGLISEQAWAQARTLQRAGIVADHAQQLTTALTALAQERRLSAQRPVPGPDVLGPARAATDAALLPVLSQLSAKHLADLSGPAGQAVSAVQDLPSALRSVRRGVDGAAEPAAAPTGAGYDSLVTSLVQLPAGVADGLADREVAADLALLSVAATAQDAAAREQLLAAPLFAVPAAAALPATVPAGDAAALAVASHEHDVAVAALSRTAAGSLLSSAAAQQRREDQVALLADVTAGTRTPGPPTSARWNELADRHAADLRAAGGLVASSAVGAVQDQVAASRSQALLTAAAAGALTLLSVLFALLLAVRITRPLRQLTDSAVQVRDELPALVARVASGVPADRVALPAVAVRGRDEVGRLAEAFRDVNATSLQVAAQQAELRAQVQGMFVNVARRTQVLLSRQLTFIDQLERGEQDPDTLQELFRLDHLATRMRRNAESLLVLAGVEGGRRLRGPMPLSDVVRSATSEIEQYERVCLDVDGDPAVVAHLALPLAHLLAELVENATVYSDPAQPVTVTVRPLTGGVRLSVVDHGLGLGADELNEINDRLARPTPTDVLGSQRLGLFVVSRLATRLDVRVRLVPGTGGGTVAVVDLPAALFSPGAVLAHPAGLDAFPEPAAPVRRTVVEPAAPPAPAPVTEQVPARLPVPALAAGQQPTQAEPQDQAQDRAQTPVLGQGDAPDVEAEAPARSVPPALPSRRSQREAERAAARRPRWGRRRTAAGALAPAVAPVAAAAAVAVDRGPFPEPVGDPFADVAALDVAPPAVATPDVAPTYAPLPGGAAPTEAGPWAGSGPGERSVAVSTATSVDVLPRRGRTRGRRSAAALPAPAPPSAVSSAGWPRTGPRAAHRAGPSVPSGPPAATQPDDTVLVATSGQPGQAPLAPRPQDSPRYRSAVASEALSELSRLSSYNPAAVVPAPSGLTRRVAAPETERAAVRPEAPRSAASPATARTDAARRPEEVRSMLTSFQSSVRRGRRAAEAEPAGRPLPSPRAPQALPAEPEDDGRLATDGVLPTESFLPTDSFLPAGSFQPPTSFLPPASAPDAAFRSPEENR